MMTGHASEVGDIDISPPDLADVAGKHALHSQTFQRPVNCQFLSVGSVVERIGHVAFETFNSLADCAVLIVAANAKEVQFVGAVFYQDGKALGGTFNRHG